MSSNLNNKAGLIGDPDFSQYGDFAQDSNVVKDDKTIKRLLLTSYFTINERNVPRSNFRSFCKVFLDLVASRGLEYIFDVGPNGVRPSKTVIRCINNLFYQKQAYFPREFKDSQPYDMLVELANEDSDEDDEESYDSICREWKKLHYDGSQNAKIFKKSLLRLVAKTKASSAPMSDYEIKYRLIKSLKGAYANISDYIDYQYNGLENVKLEDILDIIVKRYDQYKKTKSVRSRVDNEVKAYGRSHKHDDYGSMTESSTKAKIVCYSCNKEGHYKNECPSLIVKKDSFKSNASTLTKGKVKLVNNQENMTKVSRVDVNNQDGETEEGLTEISLRPICIKIGFQEIELWPSLYQKNYDGVEGIKHTILLGLFVDDMVVVSSKECDFKELVAMLNTRYTVKTVNDGSEPIYDILGLEIEYKVGSHLSMTMGKSLEEKLPKLVLEI
ncbi:uncharacterized protein SCDLUD_004966 [Saccharomycodes ludwigii]|uniref:uncharacterized protein n=1 Tax=Saccharomycodes ludwigii TaxID=36035 RepID=UPI001E828344|nr:hypothetical protein SCDLUD_004966 [Saccharomycodes ludwigii]KAH3899520.1 hypothetical protein SCDLUD_004966 [Saccharomycodes ludwigii]